MNGGGGVRWIDDATVAAALPYPELVAAMPGAFLDDLIVPRRMVLARPDGGSMLVMPAARPGGLAIVKCVTVSGPGRLEAHVTVQDAAGVPLALVAGHALTARRTAAASVLAARHLSRRKPRTLAILGSGPQARAHLGAYLACFEIAEVRIWARRSEAAAELAEVARREGVRAEVAPSPAESARGADIISCATPATVPLLRGADIAAGAHVDLVGGFRPDMREAHDAVIAQADITVDTEAAIDEAGDLVQPLQSGAVRRADIALLADRLRGRATQARRNITVFKSTGFAGEDLIAVGLLLERLGIASAKGDAR